MKRILFALALAAAACSPAPPSDDSDDSGLAGGRNGASSAAGTTAFAADSAVVFAGEKALELTEPCSRARPIAEGTWTPSEAEIAAMEPALATLLARELEAQWPDATDIAVSDYRRQYGGLILDGRRVIYVNAFRLTEYDDLDAWRTYPRTICDGGPIMFGVEYDPASRAFRNFAFNGVV